MDIQSDKDPFLPVDFDTKSMKPHMRCCNETFQEDVHAAAFKTKFCHHCQQAAACTREPHSCSMVCFLLCLLYRESDLTNRTVTKI